MGYACPVCETPQADAGHLANHLGVTAVVRGGDHEAWLDEHVPGWSDLDEAGLAEHVVEYADEADYPQVFEDTTPPDHAGHDHAHGEAGHGPPGDVPVDLGDAGRHDDELDETDRDVLERARELTRQRRDDSETE